MTVTGLDYFSYFRKTKETKKPTRKARSIIQDPKMSLRNKVLSGVENNQLG